MNIRKKSCHKPLRKPKWLSRKLPTSSNYDKVLQVVKGNKLNTVCQEAGCPNQFECFSKGSATFMILGEKCTRNCRFCNVQQGASFTVDMDEPSRVADAVKTMNLRYAVITSVTRDDLDDGGASIFADTISAIRKKCPDTLVEVLIPDLQGCVESLHVVVDAKPDVLNHNMETVAKLYEEVRPQAEYERSLQVLRDVKKLDSKMVTKTGMMVGLGECDEELEQSFIDIQKTGCDILILGQYLQPTREHVEVQRFVSPEEFEKLQKKALDTGFKAVVAEPLVRSSYKAEELYNRVKSL